MCVFPVKRRDGTAQQLGIIAFGLQHHATPPRNLPPAAQIRLFANRPLAAANPLRQKIVTILSIEENEFVRMKGLEMRTARLILAGSTAMAMLAAPLTPAPALAKNFNIPKNDDKQPAPPSSCRAYQQAPDGSWTPLPCQEGSGAQGQTQRKSAAKAQDDEAH
jgi:hypothetical protein